MTHSGLQLKAARAIALLGLIAVVACDPGWEYRAPDGIPIAGKPGWFALAGPDSTALEIFATDFTIDLSLELGVTNRASTSLWLSPAALVILDEAGEPIPVLELIDTPKAMAEVAPGATYQLRQVVQIRDARPKGYRRLRVELPARRAGPAFQIAVRLAVVE